jgi:hypothetical protein
VFATMPVGFLGDSAGAGGGGGGAGGITVTVSPDGVFEGGFANSWVFAGLTATVTGGSPSAYVWSFRNATGGSWSVFGGQGTASASPRVTSIPNGGDVQVEFVCTATVSGVDYDGSAVVGYTNFA